LGTLYGQTAAGEDLGALGTFGGGGGGSAGTSERGFSVMITLGLGSGAGTLNSFMLTVVRNMLIFRGVNKFSQISADFQRSGTSHRPLEKTALLQQLSQESLFYFFLKLLSN